MFGHRLKPRWGLDPDATYLNHGAFGATPICVLEAQRAWQDRMERQPFRFFMDALGQELRSVAGRLATYVGASGEDLVFVPNATTACNAVLQSRVGPGDKVVVLDHVYVGVGHAAEHIARSRGAQVVRVALPCPPDEGFLERLDAALVGARLAVLDHITSATALVLPIQAMVERCRDRGVEVLVDGAHAPGQVALDLEQLGATWYTGNNHKWLFAPKGSALLWASKTGQEDLHPAVISNGYGRGFHAEFDYTGTSDMTAHLAVARALDFRDELGDAAVREHNRELVLYGRQVVLEALGTRFGGREEHIGSIATIAMPIWATREEAAALSQSVWRDHQIEVPFMLHAGQLYVRLSAQVYNERSDYHRLAKVLSSLG